MSQKNNKKTSTSKEVPNKRGELFPSTDRTQLILTILAVIAAVASAIFAYTSYSSSLPRVKLENWQLADFIAGKDNADTILVRMEISNIRGVPITLVKPDITILYNTDPDASSQYYEVVIKTGDGKDVIMKSPKALVCALTSTAILEFVQVGEANSNDTVEENKICIGDDCYATPEKGAPSVLAFSGDQEKVVEKLKASGIVYLTSDDTPIYFLPGETKTILVAWYIPMDVSCNFTEIEKINLILNFNNEQSININLLSQMKITQ